MRLLLILTEFPPRIGGMQTHAAYLARHLAEQGHAIEVFTHCCGDPALAAEAADYDRELPYPVYRTLGRLSFRHNLNQLASHVRHYPADLIYASTVYYGLLRQMTGIPVVCRSVGNDVMRPWLGYPYSAGSRLLNSPRLERLLHAWLEKHHYPDWAEALFRRRREQLTGEAARAASALLANSAYTADLLRALDVPDTRIHTLVGGVDSARFDLAGTGKNDARQALRLPESAFLVMTACRLVAKKGIDLLLDALPRLRAKLPHLHLVVVGDGKYRSRFERQCADAGIGNVTFAGRIPHRDIHAYYAAADLFVLASRESVNPLTGTRDVETMGRVLCEANAAGVPVLASRSGGIPSVIADGDNGLLFDPENLDQLVEKIRHLHDRPELRVRLAARGQLRARDEFDWHHIFASHLAVFETACRAG